MNRKFGSGIMLATFLLAAFAVFAQETPDDDLMPAVDTSAAESFEAEEFEPAVDTSAAEPVEAEDIEPAVLAQDVTRSTSGNQVMDRMDLGRTEITGNQELPKVLYIVPWQKSAPSDLMARPVNTLLDEVLAPIDREEFIRQVDYYGDLYGKDEEE